MFLGDLDSPNFWQKITKWYYKFLKRKDFVKRKVWGVGQKLPENWEDFHFEIITYVYDQRMATVASPGHEAQEYINGDQFGNTDHVPTWFETSTSFTVCKRGAKDSGATSGGAEKSRMTTQLTIFKSGRKGIPKMIWKNSKKPVQLHATWYLL